MRLESVCDDVFNCVHKTISSLQTVNNENRSNEKCKAVLKGIASHTKRISNNGRTAGQEQDLLLSSAFVDYGTTASMAVFSLSLIDVDLSIRVFLDLFIFSVA
jgi:hypothetical protein